jgi:hypothetical protein
VSKGVGNPLKKLLKGMRAYSIGKQPSWKILHRVLVTFPNYILYFVGGLPILPILADYLPEGFICQRVFITL